MDLGETFRHKECYCPSCHYRLEASTAADGNTTAPESGDYSVCWDCAAILVFTDDLSVRLATQTELSEAEKWAPDKYKILREAQGVIYHVIQRRHGRRQFRRRAAYRWN